MAHQRFYVQQKALIEKGSKVLVLINPQGQIDFPGGRIDEQDGTNLAKALKREISEEVGLSVEVGRPFIVGAKSISHGPTTGEPAVMIAYQCKFISGEVALSDEHNAFQWVDQNNLHELDTTDEYFEVLKNYFSSRQTPSF